MRFYASDVKKVCDSASAIVIDEDQQAGHHETVATIQPASEHLVIRLLKKPVGIGGVARNWGSPITLLGLPGAAYTADGLVRRPPRHWTLNLNPASKSGP